MAGPDTKNIEALPVPIPGTETRAPAPDTKNLDALLDSLNGSAERFQTLWFSFLGLTLYLAIAALATTHRNLLLGEPQTLPILNIKVELLPFYVIAPLIYLVFHFYLLMMLALLARTAAEFDKRLRTTIPDDAECERYRARIENALFLQLLVGMKGERSGFNAVLLGLIAFITIALAPLATLILMQMMFLPYHHLRITWWHRAVVVVDLALIVVMTYRCFFPRGVRKAPLVLGAFSRKLRWVTAMAFCVALAVVLAPLVDWLSFGQGRWAGEPATPSFAEWARWMEGEPAPVPNVNPDYTATANGVVFGLFPDRLKLRDETIVSEQRIEETEKEMTSRGGDFVPTINLADRDLQAAVLAGADLRGVSLRGASMQGADLNAARFYGARLDVAAQLRRANLSSAKLQGTDLSSAQLQGADLSSAHLPGAKLVGADLRGARLVSAQLQGSDLWDAQLQGADFGSKTFKISFVTISVSSGAQLQGANLSSAQLQGADLEGAQLQGTNLRGAGLQDTHLDRASLADCELNGASVFRADVGDTDVSTCTIGSLQPIDKAPLFGLNLAAPSHTPTGAVVDGWRATATEFVSEENKAGIAARFDRLKPEFQTAVKDTADQTKWTELEKQSVALDPDGAQHRHRLAKILGDLACDPGGAPYVARGLIRPSGGAVGVIAARLAALGDQLEAVRKRMKDGREKPDACRGVGGFTEDDWRWLDEIRPAQDRNASGPATPTP
jgi:uncharacterized protein YjbI with pentapeptide repeats